ncbi:coxsackievirus and adenovirus receptor homolog [Nerophis ophidion]|uniref:coxsackievirus and adenovirus receptor homolog n=1 Tax=Nerophis ophidion TaxID=159077 RepID=UPI002ADF1345|nr:coxsackievirus and adenovirus receptor homolog [Nerophis ophidion]
MTSVLWYFVSVLAFCTTACALEITSKNTSYFEDKGSSVTLDCKYTHPPDTVIVKWQFTSPKHQKTLFISNSSYENENRIHFTSTPPDNGDASIIISDLRMSDAGTYQCHLMASNERTVKKMNLTVMEKLSTPVCAVEEEPVGSNDVTLKCRSSQGTPPLMYSWTKTSEKQTLLPNAIEDATGGNLFVNRISEDNCGSYLCTVESLLDTRHCDILLKCPPSSSNKSDATNYNEILLACPDSPPITSNGNKVIIAVAVTAVLLLAIVFVLSFWSLRKTNRGELVTTLWI